MTKIMLDTCALTHIIEQRCSDRVLESKSKGFEYHTTVTQLEEVNDIEKDKEKRFRIFLLLLMLQPDIDQHPSGIVGKI